jgi:hypothetical protein
MEEGEEGILVEKPNEVHGLRLEGNNQNGVQGEC